MINPQFPASSRLVAWALKRAPETMDVVEYNGRQYQGFTKLWRGNLGRKAAPIYREIGTERVYLVNNELHQVWVEKLGIYTSDYGRLRVGEVVFKLAACCRCQAELDCRESALFGACDDCISDAESDPEAIIEEWTRGKWETP